MTWRRIAWVVPAVALSSLLPATAGHAADNPCGKGMVFGSLRSDAAVLRATTCTRSAGPTPASAPGAGPASDPNVYRVVVACQARRVSDTVGGEATNCSYALSACAFRVPPSGEVLYRVEYRRRDRPGGPWLVAREMCGLGGGPAGVPAPPAAPTLAQIRAAFLRLPFARPVVVVQPVGGRTLVNLPTYFQARWPAGPGLAPGRTSAVVALLSWRVQFRVDAAGYDFRFGDGAGSGPVADPGGPYPGGRIRHTYTAPAAAAAVRVTARLSGQFRIGAGPWTDLDATADLPDGPVTTLRVLQATARLVDH